MCLATPSAPLIGEKTTMFFSMENVLNIESKRSSLHNASGCIRIQRSSLQNTSEKIDHIREEGEVYDFEWGSGAICRKVDSHVQPRS